MREVEAEILLQLDRDDRSVADAPAWGYDRSDHRRHRSDAVAAACRVLACRGQRGQRRDPTRIGAGTAEPSGHHGRGRRDRRPAVDERDRPRPGRLEPRAPGPIDEPRLLEEVRRVLGPQVRALRHAPWDPAESTTTRSAGSACRSRRSRAGCAARAATGSGRSTRRGQFELIHRCGRAPDLAKYRARQVPAAGSDRATRTGARACPPGSWSSARTGTWTTSRTSSTSTLTRPAGVCDGPQLTMSDAASHPRPAGDGQVRDVRCHRPDHPGAAGGTGGRTCPPAGAAIRTCSSSTSAASGWADRARREQPVVRGDRERAAPAAGQTVEDLVAAQLGDPGLAASRRGGAA